MRASLTSLVLVLASAFAMADERPDVGPNLVVQSAADEIRTAAGSDAAFLGAGFLKDSFSKDDLSSMLRFPTDEIVVLSLTGEQIRSALERSISLYPQQNQSFLQLSGLEVVFKKTGTPNSRVVSVSIGGSALSDGKTYSVAMPSLLAKGGLGYFKIWDQDKVAKRLGTAESILKGKRANEGSVRWTAQG
ncbi:MAG: 5'-nucleotidase C-terminal domain-containing protein [Fimbriimonas sp.]